jgi:hypothetical protein
VIGIVYQALSNLTKLIMPVRKAKAKRTGSRRRPHSGKQVPCLRILKQHFKTKARIRAAVAAAREESL